MAAQATEYAVGGEQRAARRPRDPLLPSRRALPSLVGESAAATTEALQIRPPSSVLC